MLIVQKYGGTSLKDDERLKAVAEKIKRAKEENNDDFVIVVSAPSGMTDALLDRAHKISENPNLREVDAILSTGEQLSAGLLSIVLQDIGVPAISLNALQIGICTDNKYGGAKILAINNKRITDNLKEGKVVIVTGFQGVSGGDITTLGRGGSDTTATAVGISLNADKIEIYSDVDGFCTGNPRIIDNTKKLDMISYDEALELASLGAKVMHDRSITLAMQNNAPLYLRNSYNDNSGTLIGDRNPMEEPKFSGVTNYESCSLIRIKMEKSEYLAKKMDNFYERVRDLEINLELISTSIYGNSVNTSITVETEDDFRKFKDNISSIKESSNLEYIEIDKDIAKISLVGIGMRDAGVFANLWLELSKEDIEILMISTSEIAISCIVRRKDMEKGAQILHKFFIEEE